LRSRIQHAEQTLVSAVQATKEHRYDDAINRLELLAKEQDFRFAEKVEQANRALVKIKAIRDQMLVRADLAIQASKAAATIDDRAEVIRQLESVPACLLDSESTKLLAQSKAYAGEVSQLTGQLRSALAEKDWRASGNLIDRLIKLKPEDEAFQTLAKQIASKLFAKAERRFAKLDYNVALEYLDAYPVICHDNAYLELRLKVEQIVWLTRQFAGEPYATPTLGRLALRLTKQSTDDARGHELVSRLSASLKEPVANNRNLFPAWVGSRKCSLGGEAAILAWPRMIDCKADPIARKSPGRYTVAIGLALQGLGIARVNSLLWEKKSLLGGIANFRKNKSCWGIDIGNAGIRAIHLQKNAEQIIVAEAYSAEFPPATRLGKEGRGVLVLRDAIKVMLEQIEIGNGDVIANFSSREILARFIDLPPVNDKKAKQLLDREATGQFPFALDELSMVKWISEKPDDLGVGRPAAILAAKKMAVNNRVDLLNEAGLKVTGLQCEALALVNLASYEFEIELATRSDATEACLRTSDKSRNAIAIVDAGAASTTLVLVDKCGFWFRAIEGGGEDMTMGLARSAKVVADEAEKLKRDPSSLTNPANQYQNLEDRLDALAIRLKQVANDFLKQNQELLITQTWAVGGGCFAHGWMRRVLCNTPK